MSDRVPALEHEFARLLRHHLARGGEGTLHSAYEVGRGALAEGLGVLDVGTALVRALLDVAADRSDAPLPREPVEAFALEALSPFEMAHRGARQANQVLRRLEEVREEEVHRVARELHDSAGQLLASVHLALDELASESAPEVGERLDRVRAMLARVEEQLRRIAHEFRPAMLDDFGLRPALAYLAENVSRRTGLRIEIADRTEGRLPARIETALYRVAQEALTNVTRHARASRVTVHLAREQAQVVCRIEDDGVGFDAAAWSSRPGVRGIGLRGIRERVAGLGGTLEVRSAQGRGAELRLHIPLEVPHAHPSLDRR